MGRARARGPSVWIGTEEAARILQWSETRVRSHRRELGGRKVNDRLRYRRSLVEAIAATSRPELKRSPTVAPSVPLEQKPLTESGFRTETGLWAGVVALVGAMLLGAAGVIWGMVWLVGSLFGSAADPVEPSPSPPSIQDYAPSPARPYVTGFRPHALCRDGTVSYSLSNSGTCS